MAALITIDAVYGAPLLSFEFTKCWDGAGIVGREVRKRQFALSRMGDLSHYLGREGTTNATVHVVMSTG